jgi:lipopolysaccharide/colanic/teichoic acid biosynthesis glycosyltransferase
MRIRPPSSRAALRIRLSAFDVALAALSPLLALYVRDAYILSYDGLILAGMYCLVSLTFSLIALAMFGVQDGIPRYFSVHDAINLAKAVLIGELMTCVLLFTVTRLEGIPRSTPVIHALLFGAGLITTRAFAHVAGRERKLAETPRHFEAEHIILIGLNDLASLYMKILEACVPEQQIVVAVLDEEPRSIGRSINGVRVFGPLSHLRSLIEEFSVHGIRVDRVVVSGEGDILSDEGRREIERVCAHSNITLEFLPRLFGRPLLTPAEQPASSTRAVIANHFPEPEFVLPAYFRWKPILDFFVALILLVSLLPLWILVLLLALIDVGPPVLFWQRRTGMNGRHFLLHKIRTLRSLFDWEGQRVPEEQRLSWFGHVLRTTRLDELPQLLNVLVGDMSLIGPRPLLLEHQPSPSSVRLMVRPGITGWAQVHGGALLSPTEKETLDEWYIRHASLWLDFRIGALTVLSLVKGDRRSQPVLAQTGELPGQRDILRPAPQGERSHVSTMPTPLLVDDDRPPRSVTR